MHSDELGKGSGTGADHPSQLQFSELNKMTSSSEWLRRANEDKEVDQGQIKNRGHNKGRGWNRT